MNPQYNIHTARSGKVMAALAVFAILAATLTPTQASIIFTTTFDDPGSTFTAFYPDITAHVTAAGGFWDQFIAENGNVFVEVEVGFDATIPTSNGGSLTSSFVRTQGGIDIFEQGAAAEIKTGLDPNGATPDVRIDIGVMPGSNYLVDELWFDPNPMTRIDPVPSTRTDAVSVFLHELGHALGFNGFRDLFDASLPPPGNFQSTFDQWITFDGMNMFFNGPLAQGVYGSPVPLTFGNIFHVGNMPPRPGDNLIPDLMNGVVFDRGTRYDISHLDVFMLGDAELSVTPEPTTVALLMVGLGLFLLSKRRRKH